MENLKVLNDPNTVAGRLHGFFRRHYGITKVDYIYDFIKKIDENPNISNHKKEYLRVKLVSCRYKLCALMYHERNIRYTEKKYKKALISISRQLIKGKGTFATNAPEIMFEFEAYLLQCKAFLDIFSQLLGSFSEHNPSNMKKLKKILLLRKDPLAQDLLRLIRKNTWLIDFDSSESLIKTKRDIVAHYSNLELSAINIQRLDIKKFNTIRTKVEDKYVIDYIWSINTKMRRFVREALKIIESKSL
ncbi:hypothetical protein HYX06_05725 [Candidatus Woesearchaeota archaeon]|nr:hypothetical protein [Candidatus Woesearchaeota archaeon]